MNLTKKLVNFKCLEIIRVNTSDLEEKSLEHVSDLRLADLVRCETIKVLQFTPEKLDITVHYFDLNRNETTELLLMFRSKVMKLLFQLYFSEFNRLVQLRTQSTFDKMLCLVLKYLFKIATSLV